MNMRVIGTSCALVAVSAIAVFAQQASDQRRANVREPRAQSSPVTMTGCVVRQRDSSAHPLGSATPGGGTLADTNAGAAPTGSAAVGSTNRGSEGDELLLIVTASRTVTSPGSAVPGSASSPGDTGTIPSQTHAGTAGASQSRAPTAFHLVFAPGTNSSSYVGQRVEVTGAVSAKSGTVATDANEVTRAGAATTGTRAEVARDPESHPSADLSDLSVQTIKRVSGRCETP